MKTGYGGGRATEMRFPAREGDLDAPVRSGAVIEPQNRTPWLNQQEFGVDYLVQANRFGEAASIRWNRSPLGLWRRRITSSMDTKRCGFPGPLCGLGADEVFQLQRKAIGVNDFRFAESYLDSKFDAGLAWLGGDDFNDRDIVPFLGTAPGCGGKRKPALGR